MTFLAYQHEMKLPKSNSLANNNVSASGTSLSDAEAKIAKQKKRIKRLKRKLRRLA